ncbi:ABC transporter permease [Rhodoligotrophos ferricapiens]|uniref:ABC transporter permease n=1 Tax=Rhodoligotrophos ferricapiens TaxID=3069264 RepID=UPI00315D8BC2
MLQTEMRTYYLLLVPALVIMGIFFVVPLSSVLWISVTDPAPGLENYTQLLTSDLIHRIWWNTVRICVITTLGAVILGYVVAYAMAQVSPRHRSFMLLCVIITFWFSVLVRAFAWVMLLRPEGPVNSALMGIGLIEEPLYLVRNELGVLIGMIHYMLPVAILPLYSNMKSIPHKFTDAARGLGASPLKAFFLVYLPMTKPGILAAAILVFIISLGFYITPAILGGGRVVMIAEYIRVSFDETLRWGHATMLASTLLFVVVAILVVLSRIVDLKKVFGA